MNRQETLTKGMQGTGRREVMARWVGTGALYGEIREACLGLTGQRGHVRNGWTEQPTSELSDSMIRMSQEGQDRAEDNGTEMSKHLIEKGTQNKTVRSQMPHQTDSDEQGLDSGVRGKGPMSGYYGR